MNDQWTAPGFDPPGGSPPAPTPPTAYPTGPHPPGPTFSPPAAPGGWRPAFDIRPGVIPLRPLTLGDFFSAAFKTVRGNLGASVGLAALTSVAVMLPLSLIGIALSSLDDAPLLPDSTGQTVDFSLGGSIASSLGQQLPSFGSMLIAIPLAGFISFVVGQAVLGRKVSMAQTWQGVKPVFGSFVLATVVIFLMVILGIALLIGVIVGLFVLVLDPASSSQPSAGAIVAAVLVILFLSLALVLLLAYVTNRLAFTIPALVLERGLGGPGDTLGLLGALRRSWTLVGGLRAQPFWRLFGIRLLTGMVVGMASSIIVMPLMLIFVGLAYAVGVSQDGTAGQLAMASTAVGALVGILAGALTTPFTGAVDGLLYVDFRIRQEGLDVALIQAAQGVGAPPWAVAPAEP